MKSPLPRARWGRVRYVTHEPLAPVHPAPGRHVAADGRDPAGWRARVSLPAAVGFARSRLPHDPDHHAVSRRESRSDDLVGDRAVGASVRTTAGTQPDVVDEFGR